MRTLLFLSFVFFCSQVSAYYYSGYGPTYGYDSTYAYPSYSYYPSYNSYYAPSLGSGSYWAAGGGLVGNVVSFFIG
ncbi:unnamed protein product [Auanema sp. JU1783]|nr:unnamed protein product [Auanema sp. JU1783]